MDEKTMKAFRAEPPLQFLLDSLKLHFQAIWISDGRHNNKGEQHQDKKNQKIYEKKRTKKRNENIP